MQEKVQNWLMQLQDSICSSLEQLDGKASFHEDKWERPGGGGGRSRVIENGTVFEKGGVNFSAVHGSTPAFLLKEINNIFPAENKTDLQNFLATGVSLVIHPESPMIPIIHMNVRYFRINDNVQWFGGGIDLTPAYVVEDDARFFHTQLKTICDKHHPDYYPEFKKWADDYFFISHRNETRGVGGIFFDKLIATNTIGIEQRFDFLKDVGELFIPVYSEIVKRNKDLPYQNNHKEWQSFRRGRYVEFNLVYDKGTKFGLETGGRTESILMSLPPLAKWKYDHKPENGSAEEKTLEMLKKGIEWSI